MGRHAIDANDRFRMVRVFFAASGDGPRSSGTPHGYLSQSASQQQDEQDEQNKPAETPSDSRATVVKPAAAK